MDDIDPTMSESDVSALKETLYSQQRLLQKLYNELEAEREASASAAKEALSVILRLEGEKAAVKMEAQQYKRLSEQKICHAEESLTIIEDVIYQKEMEVAALDHQVQAYRYKLLSMGCTDPGLGELRFQDNREEINGETSIGRRNSAPVPCKYRSLVNEGESCNVAERDSGDEKTKIDVCDQGLDSETKIDVCDGSSPGGISSYFDQIRKLEVRVMEIAGGKSMSSRSESPSSLSSRTSDLYRKNTMRETDQTKSPESRKGVAADSSCSMSIHDVFEVPKVEESLNCHEVVHPEAVKMGSGDEPDWIKKVLQYSQSESKMLQTSNVNCGLVVVEPTTSVSESLNRVVRTSEIVEEVGERAAEASSREEELKLLNEIKEKLDLLHHEVRELKVKEKCLKRDEPSLSLLSEAMLHFWL